MRLEDIPVAAEVEVEMIDVEGRAENDEERRRGEAEELEEAETAVDAAVGAGINCTWLRLGF